MRVKIKLRQVKGKKAIVDVRTGEVREEDEVFYALPELNIRHEIVFYNRNKPEAEIIIFNSDYDKIKDIVTEIIDENVEPQLTPSERLERLEQIIEKIKQKLGL